MPLPAAGPQVECGGDNSGGFSVAFCRTIVTAQRLNVCSPLLGLLIVLAGPMTAQRVKPEAATSADKSQSAKRAGDGQKHGSGAESAEAKVENAYNYSLPGPDGKNVPLSNYKDKYILLVNLGRKSTYNEQLPALIKLNDTYKDKNLVVIGVPSNEFGAAEPGTQAEVLKAYADAKVDFPVMGLSKLAGDDALPLYAYLTTSKSAPAGGAVAWNYTKFVIDKQGNVVARMDSDVKPDSPEMLSILDEILAGTYKPKKESGKSDAHATMDEAN